MLISETHYTFLGGFVLFTKTIFLFTPLINQPIANYFLCLYLEHIDLWFTAKTTFLVWTGKPASHSTTIKKYRNKIQVQFYKCVYTLNMCLICNHMWASVEIIKKNIFKFFLLFNSHFIQQITISRLSVWHNQRLNLSLSLFLFYLIWIHLVEGDEGLFFIKRREKGLFLSKIQLSCFNKL